MRVLRDTVQGGKVTLASDSLLEEGVTVLVVVDALDEAPAAIEEVVGVSAANLLPKGAGQAKLMDLQGLGREVWQGEDAGAYIDRLRADWE